jgi:hypothetical protein
MYWTLVRLTPDQAALKHSGVDENLRSHDHCEDSDLSAAESCPESFRLPGRVWTQSEIMPCIPRPANARHIGKFALTSAVAPWVMKALSNHKPSPEVFELIRPFAKDFHDTIERERTTTLRLHDIDAIELTYQCTLEICAAILLAADKTDDPVQLDVRLHASNAGGDDHFTPWGHLLTGLECEVPIIVQFPFYLLMCQSFTLEPINFREDYVYAALTGIDWVRIYLILSLAGFQRHNRAKIGFDKHG